MTYSSPENEARRYLAAVEAQVAELEARGDADERLLRNLKRERAAWRASVRGYEARSDSHRSR